ncbi:MAG: DUF4397 domain-containing protein [Gemmatimonadaceae bacterium]|nr:DUF4397 domain-containing protein [Gemmatimonadaceae bacterium]
MLASRRATLAATALVVLAACDSGGDPTRPAQRDARARVVHLVPDGPLLDFRINDALRDPQRALGYGAVVDYTNLPAQTTVVTAQQAPSTNRDTPVPLLTSSRIDLVAGLDYSFVVTGRVTAPAVTETPTFTVYADTNTAPPAGTARVRVLHASPDAGGVDVYLLPPGTTTIAAGTAPTVPGIAFRSRRVVTPTAGSYAVIVTAVGERTVVLARRDNVAIVAGSGVTVALRGFVGVPIGQVPVEQQLGLQFLVDRAAP